MRFLPYFLILILLLALIVEAKKGHSREKSKKGRRKHRKSSEGSEEDYETEEEFCRRRPDHRRCRSRYDSEEDEEYEYTTRSPRRRPKYTTPEPDRTTTKPPPESNPPPNLRLTGKQKRQLKSSCRKISGNCKTQSPEARSRRAVVYDHVVEALRAGGHEQDAEEKTERILNKMFQAKKAVLEREGLAEIIPSDDGTWGGDQILTEEQSQRIIEEGEDRRRQKRYSLLLEEEVSSKWDLPIKYMIDVDFEPTEPEVLREALKDIEDKTCIRFEEEKQFIDGPHIAFRKTYDPSFCGLSYLGRVDPFNVVWLNYDCDTIKGTAVHELLHALGADHQHVRYDRNSYIITDWVNVDPQTFDLFAGDSDRFTSFGIPYDYFSVMHYPSWVGAINEDKPTIMAAKEPRKFYDKAIGQRFGLSDRDAELLRKMYCMPDCEDENVYCGWWATSDYCETHQKRMAQMCKKSCDYCPAMALMKELGIDGDEDD